MENKKIALFIDAENISSDYAKFIFDKVSSYGEIIIKRIYADWTNEQPKNWKDNIGEYSITAIQCFTFASKKNSSDMYLTTDIAEILYDKNIEKVANPNNKELAKEYEILRRKFYKAYDIDKIERLVDTSEEIKQLKNDKKLLEKLNEEIKKYSNEYEKTESYLCEDQKDIAYEL